MTVNQLHRALADLIARGHGRKPVCVDKSSFGHPLEQDGAVVLDIAEVTEPRFICLTDDDGGTKWNKDGSEAGRMTVLLRGEREKRE